MTNIKYIKDYYTINENDIFYKYYKNGTPTVIFEAGLGDSNNTWKEIQERISKYTATFSYDRAGVGNSKGKFKSRTGLNIVHDFLKLISKVSLDPPFLLVGHSFGGLISRLYASINPDNVAGMILIDAAPENKETSFLKVLTNKNKIKIKKYLKNPDLNSEKINKIETYKQISKYKRQIKFPLTIVIRGLAECYGAGWPEEKLLEVERKLQLNYKKLSNKSNIVIAKKSGHYIHKDEPDLVIKEIKRMINKINSPD